MANDEPLGFLRQPNLRGLDAVRYDSNAVEIASKDILIGEGGADTLAGGKGNDQLAGGRGFDSYLIGEDDGFDVIEDQDGSGYIEWGATDATPGSGEQLAGRLAIEVSAHA